MTVTTTTPEIVRRDAATTARGLALGLDMLNTQWIAMPRDQRLERLNDLALEAERLPELVKLLVASEGQ